MSSNQLNEITSLGRGAEALIKLKQITKEKGIQPLTVRDSVQVFTELGVPTIPVTKDKAPLVKEWKSFQTSVPTPLQVEKWFRNLENNYAIICGKISGLVVVDCDSDEALDFARSSLPIPLLKIKTSQGEHWFYRYPETETHIKPEVKIKINNKQIAIDIRADGSYVVGVGSIHKTGLRYSIIEEDYNDLAEFNPAWFHSFNEQELESIKLGSYEERFKFAKEFVANYAPAIEGNGGDHHTFVLCCRLVCDYGLSELDALSVLSDWNNNCRPSWSDDELRVKIKNAIKYGGNLKATSWLDLISLDEISLPAFPENVFPTDIEEYCSQVSKASETPRDLICMLALAALSTAVRGSYKIKVNSGFAEPSPLWVVVALESGNRKSFAVSKMFEPIYEFEKLMQESAQVEIVKTNCKIKTIEQQVKSLRKSLDKTDVNHSQVLAEIEKLELEKPRHKSLPRLTVNDVTTEKLAMIMAGNDERIALVSDEGGFFETMGGRYNKQVPNFDLFLQGYSESAVRVDRIRSDEAIQMNHPCITIGATVQPSILSALSKRPEFKSLGLLSRVLFAIPKSPLGYRTGHSFEIDVQLSNKYKQTLKRILSNSVSGGDF